MAKAGLRLMPFFSRNFFLINLKPGSSILCEQFLELSQGTRFLAFMLTQIIQARLLTIPFRNLSPFRTSYNFHRTDHPFPILEIPKEEAPLTLKTFENRAPSPFRRDVFLRFNSTGSSKKTLIHSSTLTQFFLRSPRDLRSLNFLLSTPPLMK